MKKQSNIRPFYKMHGLGNDFIIFDAREDALNLTSEQVRALADRKHGIGCDQLIVMEKCDRADVFMKIWNANGSPVGACGNATRCVGHLMDLENRGTEVRIQTDAGVLSAKSNGHEDITVDMGEPKLDWQSIPLYMHQDTLALDLHIGPFKSPVAVNMGNPHAVFFVADAELAPLEEYGHTIETHALFPEHVNVSAASVHDGIIRLRVWERGVGMTLACGTAACATIVAASLKGLIDRKAIIELDGGKLDMTWLDNGHVLMTGPVATSFIGEVAL